MRHLTLTTAIIAILIVGSQACGGMEEDFEASIESTGQALLIQPDHFEFNDTPQTATHLPSISRVYQRLTITANDQDWFRVHVAAGKKLFVEIYFAHNDANLELAVFGDCMRGCSLVGFANSRSDNETLYLPGLRAGEYWITTFDHGHSAKYDLMVGLR